MRADRGFHQGRLHRRLSFGTALVGLLFAFALAAVPTTGSSQSRPYRTFDETVIFIDSKLSQVNRNKRVGYRLTVSTICVAHWGNDSIRTELAFSLLDRTGANTGGDSSVICQPARNSRSRVQACIPIQFRSESGWRTLRKSTFARFPAGSEADSAEVQDALSYLMEICGRR